MSKSIGIVEGPPQDEVLKRLEIELPHSQDDERVRRDAKGKINRLRAWMDEKQLDGVLVSRRDNFAWLTAGGDNHVLINTEFGVGHLLITRDKQYLLSFSMDGDRLLDEEIPGQGYQTVMQRWYQGDPRQNAFSLAGERLAADTVLAGAQDISAEISLLHGPLTELELQRCRWLGRQTGLLLEAIAHWIKPGMAESEIGRYIQATFAVNNIDVDVVIVGSDERLDRYRHPLPSAKPLKQYALIHPAARRWGLHANVNRCLSFGEPPERIRRAHLAAATIEGRVLAMLKPGLAFADILAQEKRWFAELGYPDEWELHFQGGPTGYIVGDPARCFTDDRVITNQAFDWFITVNGIQVEELSLLTEQGFEVASLGKDWPTVQAAMSNQTVSVPGIMIL
jgi:Xaa-Pro dipeptidase